MKPVPDPPLDLPSEKRALRMQIADARHRLGPNDPVDVGLRAVNWFSRDARCRAAERVGLYAALSDEPATRPLFDALRAEGRQVVMPRCLSAHRLEFAPVDRWDELETGRYGVPEPVTAPWNEAWRETDLVVVPGVAFDRSGGRLGRGGGYYDRAFDPAIGCVPRLLGFAFAFQVVAAVPMGAMDRRMDGLLTGDSVSWLDG